MADGPLAAAAQRAAAAGMAVAPHRQGAHALARCELVAAEAKMPQIFETAQAEDRGDMVIVQRAGVQLRKLGQLRRNARKCLDAVATKVNRPQVTRHGRGDVEQLRQRIVCGVMGRLGKAHTLRPAAAGLAERSEAAALPAALLSRHS